MFRGHQEIVAIDISNTPVLVHNPSYLERRKIGHEGVIYHIDDDEGVIYLRELASDDEIHKYVLPKETDGEYYIYTIYSFSEIQDKVAFYDDLRKAELEARIENDKGDAEIVDENVDKYADIRPLHDWLAGKDVD